MFKLYKYICTDLFVCVACLAVNITVADAAIRHLSDTGDDDFSIKDS